MAIVQQLKISQPLVADDLEQMRQWKISLSRAQASHTGLSLHRLTAGMDQRAQRPFERVIYDAGMCSMAKSGMHSMPPGTAQHNRPLTLFTAPQYHTLPHVKQRTGMIMPDGGPAARTAARNPSHAKVAPRGGPPPVAIARSVE